MCIYQGGQQSTKTSHKATGNFCTVMTMAWSGDHPVAQLPASEKALPEFLLAERSGEKSQNYQSKFTKSIITSGSKVKLGITTCEWYSFTSCKETTQGSPEKVLGSRFCNSVANWCSVTNNDSVGGSWKAIASLIVLGGGFWNQL